MIFTKPLMNEYPDLSHPSMNGIVGLWNFNERGGDTVYDQSGNHNDGILDGPTWEAGQYGPALGFNGIHDGVTIAHADLNNPIDSFTVSTTITPEVDATEEIVIKGDVGDDLHHRFRRISTGVRLYVGPSGTFAFAPLTAGNTYNLVGVWDGTTAKLYVNGLLIDDDASATEPSGTAADITLGFGSSPPFTGLIHSYSMSPHDLTAPEVLRQFNFPWAAWYRDDSALLSAAIKAGGPPTFNPAWALSSNQLLL